MKRNKRKELLNLLLEGWVLSKIQILDKVQLLNGGDAIMQLRKQGYIISMKKVKNEHTQTYFAVYYMPDFVKNLSAILKSYNS